MYEVLRFHQHKSAIVAPSVLVVTFPLGGAQSALLSEHVQVGHGNVEPSVRSSTDVRVAYAPLVGDAVARNDRFAVVHGLERVAVITDSHEQTVGRIVEVSEEICSHILLLWRLLCVGSRHDCEGNKRNSAFFM